MKTQTCKTAAVMGLISRGPASAPAHAGGSTPAPAERTIEEITADILQAQVDGGKAVLIIGNGLIEAKGKLDHGQWLDWLTENVGYSEKSAENYMRIARNYSNPQLVADLGMRKALSLLALPETDRETFVAEANVVDMTSRELEKAVRERAEALEATAASRRTAKRHANPHHPRGRPGGPGHRRERGHCPGPGEVRRCAGGVGGGEGPGADETGKLSSRTEAIRAAVCNRKGADRYGKV